MKFTLSILGLVAVVAVVCCAGAELPHMLARVGPQAPKAVPFEGCIGIGDETAEAHMQRCAACRQRTERATGRLKARGMVP